MAGFSLGMVVDLYERRKCLPLDHTLMSASCETIDVQLMLM